MMICLKIVIVENIIRWKLLAWEQCQQMELPGKTSIRFPNPLQCQLGNYTGCKTHLMSVREPDPVNPTDTNWQIGTINNHQLISIVIISHKILILLSSYQPYRGTDGWSEGTPGPKTGCQDGKQLNYGR